MLYQSFWPHLLPTECKLINFSPYGDPKAKPTIITFVRERNERVLIEIVLLKRDGIFTLLGRVTNNIIGIYSTGSFYLNLLLSAYSWVLLYIQSDTFSLLIWISRLCTFNVITDTAKFIAVILLFVFYLSLLQLFLLRFLFPYFNGYVVNITNTLQIIFYPLYGTKISSQFLSLCYYEH